MRGTRSTPEGPAAMYAAASADGVLRDGDDRSRAGAPAPTGSDPATVAARARPRRRLVGWRGTGGSVLLYLFTLLCLVTVVFLLPRTMPGDPLTALEDPGSGLFFADEQAREAVLAYYGLDRPLPVQYADYVTSVARGDLGWSISRNQPVSSLIAQHLPWTLLLMGAALLLSSVVSFLAGMAAAWRRGGLRDRVLVSSLTGAQAVPEYALAAVFLLLFGVAFPIFPLYGARTMFVEYGSWLAAAGDVLSHLALPLAALTISLLGAKFLLVRNSVLSALGAEYMVLARAKGLPERLLKYRHAGRNALLPFLTVLGIHAAFAVGGSIFVEAVFAYPGMGTLVLDAVQARDYPVLEAVFLTLAATVLTANLLIELLYARLDPRVGAE